METWKLIPGFDRYEASTYGRIRYKKDGFILSCISHSNHYLVVNFTHPSRKQHLVHRLIAKTFIQNENNKLYINHKDFNRHNNSIENLEWVTMKENKKYNYLHDREGNKVLNMETGIFYDTVIEAINSLDPIFRRNRERTAFYRMLNGLRKNETSLVLC